ncbi:DUF2917 domain-containing protein [Roseateles amylovorans]|uniref:DUF2917 domain-containing protein n=1 Tax=Roseateles amylovorans TaxID=2978473 RepID=A0ABY6B005_9BURK|nr:DUF2917 domain-containing protein [Roseateles amylovorans]UXH78746.1 DUF2917 domain-containing protein [Roseateles amylovorans]
MNTTLPLSPPAAPAAARPPISTAPELRDQRTEGVAAADGARRLQLPEDGRTVSLRLHRPTRLQVERGRVWITRPGWPQDHWLNAGETLEFRDLPRWRGLTLLISGEDASIPITLKVEALR